MAITPQIIGEVVSREDDFGHELRVAQVLRAYRFSPMGMEHGGTYDDPATGRPRQFDLRWQLRNENCVLHAAVECKNTSREVPVVICGIDRTPAEAFHMLIESRRGTYGYNPKPGGGFREVVDGLSSRTLKATGNDSFYAPSGFVGKSVIRVRPDRDKKDNYSVMSDGDIYEKWSQALASAVDLVRRACDLSESLGGQTILSAILPIVVLPNESLWHVKYDHAGKIIGEAELTDRSELYVASQIFVREAQQFCFSHIHFFTVTGLMKFLLELTREHELWPLLFNANALERAPSGEPRVPTKLA